MTYTPPPGEEIPVESHVAVALTVRGLTGGMQDEHRAARQLIADLAKVGVVIGDMQQWRRNFLRGHVAGGSEDHRLAGVIADQADELDADRVRIAELEAEVERLRYRLDEMDVRAGEVLDSPIIEGRTSVRAEYVAALRATMERPLDQKEMPR